MARIWVLKSSKWLVEIRKKGSPYISKTFHDIKHARKFARIIESEMECSVFN